MLKGKKNQFRTWKGLEYWMLTHHRTLTQNLSKIGTRRTHLKYAGSPEGEPLLEISDGSPGGESLQKLFLSGLSERGTAAEIFSMSFYEIYGWFIFHGHGIK